MKRRIRYCYIWVLVWLGFRQWAKMKYNRPKYQICVFHCCKMKRWAKTETGAHYYCPKCKRSYHLQGGGNKLVPLEVR